jgi:hypothetical protein
MEIKNYDDMIVVECNEDKLRDRFNRLLTGKSRWIQISGKSFFATTMDNYQALRLIVDEINSLDDVVLKYNSKLEMRLKEEYYKSFDCRPLHFSAELRKRSKKSMKSLSSSVYDDDTTSSSDGFPSPGTPGVKQKKDRDDDDEVDNLEYIIDKLNELEDRIEKLEEW